MATAAPRRPQHSILVVYDPYYCLGAVVDAIAALGVARENVLNANRDFYADIAQGSVPEHGILVTNPPYSADHKQKLLDFLVAAASSASAASSTAKRAAPFALLMPAWVAATDYWQHFLRKLARVRRGCEDADDPAAATATAASAASAASTSAAHESPVTPLAPRAPGARSLERQAGVFYLSPLERYTFSHPQSTGHATSPFHSIWFCGGWTSKAARKAALASLRELRETKQLEVFRDAAMLQRRAHFVPASHAKRQAHAQS